VVYEYPLQVGKEMTGLLQFRAKLGCYTIGIHRFSRKVSARSPGLYDIAPTTSDLIDNNTVEPGAESKGVGY
jgi:hypothetical protein